MPKIARPPLRRARAEKAATKSAPKMAEKSVKAVAKRAQPAAVARAIKPEPKNDRPQRSWTQGGLPSRDNGHNGHGHRHQMSDRFMRDVTCRSCGKRPGRPTAIIGQLTATELCEVCATLRKERIRANRASQRGYRL